jgi:hypothetical protein
VARIQAYNSMGNEQALPLKSRDPVAYYLERSRISAAKRLRRVIVEGLEGTLPTDQLGSISLGLKAALAVLGLPGNLPDPSRSQQASVTINLGVPLQQHEPSQPELRDGGFTLHVGQRNGDPQRPQGA